MGHPRRPRIAFVGAWMLALLALAGAWPRVAWACLDGRPCDLDCTHGVATRPQAAQHSCCNAARHGSDQTVSSGMSCRVSVVSPDRDLTACSESRGGTDEAAVLDADRPAICAPVRARAAVYGTSEGPPGPSVSLTPFLRAPPRP